MKHIVKRKGHTEDFDDRKLYASVFSALMILRISDEEAEAICAMVVDDVKKEIVKKRDVTAQHIHTEAARSLKKYHPDAAYLYNTHRDLS
jgi:transcriptional regulator NrdR family protein